MDAMQPRIQQTAQPQYSVSVPSAPPHTLARNGMGMTATAYPSLTEFMGLELTEEMIRLNMPEYVQQPATHGSGSTAVSMPHANPSSYINYDFC